MKIAIFFAISFLVFVCRGKPPLKPTQYIAGGSNSPRYNTPFQVSIQTFFGAELRHTCGGVILTPQFTLTAAHCLNAPFGIIILIAGMLNQGETSNDLQISQVSKTILHPFYNRKTKSNDIALLKLKVPFVFTKAVRSIKLPYSCTRDEGLAVISGWGYTGKEQITPTNLQEAIVPILSLPECDDILHKFGKHVYLDHTMICAGTVYGQGNICEGDSGGPMIQNMLLIGVASWSCDPCATSKCPSVYTRVCLYKNFILQYVPDSLWS